MIFLFPNFMDYVYMDVCVTYVLIILGVCFLNFPGNFIDIQ